MSYVVSLTRLRLRSALFLPAFALSAWRAHQQVRAAEGFVAGALLPDARRAFWTLTLWDSEQSMRAYVTQGAHRAAMPRLVDWCDEASIAHWEQAEPVLPGWREAEARMRREGRAAKVRHPSPDHAALTFAPLREAAAGPIARKPSLKTGS